MQLESKENKAIGPFGHSWIVLVLQCNVLGEFSVELRSILSIVFHDLNSFGDNQKMCQIGVTNFFAVPTSQVASLPDFLDEFL